MEIPLSSRVRSVRPSPTLAVSTKAAELRAQGRDVISLAAGEPDFDTPNYIKSAAIAAIEEGFTKYTAVGGIPSLRVAIAEKFERDNKLKFQPEQIMVCNGGKQCLYNLFQALLEEGDEVLIPTPYWVSYPDMARLSRAEPVFIKTNFDQRFKVTPEVLDRHIGAKSKLLVLNSPSNPTGVEYSAEELEALGKVLEKHPKLMIVSDEIYESIRYLDTPYQSIASVLPHLLERIIIVNGVSKAYAMTGWRIGYVAADAALIKAMITIQSQSTSNPCAIAQRAAEAALRGPAQAIAPMQDAFRSRHEYVIARLKQLQDVRAYHCDGAFYAFPDFSAVMEKKGFATDIQLAEDLLEKAGVAVVPGSAFGSPGALRMSFASSLANLEDALDRIEHYLNQE